MTIDALTTFVTRWQDYAAQRFPMSCLDDAVEELRVVLASIDTQVSRPLEILALGGAVSPKQRATIAKQHEAVATLQQAAGALQTGDAAGRDTLEAIRAYAALLSQTLTLAVKAIGA